MELNQDIKINTYQTLPIVTVWIFKTIFFRTWFDKGVHTVKRPCRYQLQTIFFTYYGLINALPQEYKKAIKLEVAYSKPSAAKWVIKIKVTITKMMTDVYNNNLFLDILLHIEWK